MSIIYMILVWAQLLVQILTTTKLKLLRTENIALDS